MTPAETKATQAITVYHRLREHADEAHAAVFHAQQTVDALAVDDGNTDPAELAAQRKAADDDVVVARGAAEVSHNRLLTHYASFDSLLAALSNEQEISEQQAHQRNVDAFELVRNSDELVEAQRVVSAVIRLGARIGKKITFTTTDYLPGLPPMHRGEPLSPVAEDIRKLSNTHEHGSEPEFKIEIKAV